MACKPMNFEPRRDKKSLVCLSIRFVSLVNAEPSALIVKTASALAIGKKGLILVKNLEMKIKNDYTTSER